MINYLALPSPETVTPCATFSYDPRLLGGYDPRFDGQGMGFPTLNTNSHLDRLSELCKIR